MSFHPKSIDTLNKALEGVGFTPAKIKELGITNVQIVSTRSIRFDLPDKVKNPADKDAPPNINRIKITARDDSTLDIRFIEVIEHELVGGVPPDGLAACLEKFAGLKLS